MSATATLSSTMLPTFLRVSRVRRETEDTVSLWIDAAGASAFLPGQFNMLYAYAVGEVPISMSGDPASANTLIHTIKAVGAVSRALCGLRKGAMVGVRGPYGRPWPMDAARGQDLILVAGGLGLAPLRPLVYHILRHRQDYGQIWLLVGARTPDDLLFARELARWRARGDLHVVSTVDRAGPSWKGRVGVVPALLSELRFDPQRTVAFVCGPEVMMRFTIRELAQRALPERNIYVSLERNMECALGLCGHCQYGSSFICKDGPVFRFDAIRSRFSLREL